MQPRVKPEKPGRELVVLYDKRFPLIEGFENNYLYVVNFGGIGKSAGNHYHEKKKELYYVLIGEFEVYLEKIETKEREKIDIKAERQEIIYIPEKTAHIVIAKSSPACLLVLASYPNNEEDEFPYNLKI